MKLITFFVAENDSGSNGPSILFNFPAEKGRVERRRKHLLPRPMWVSQSTKMRLIIHLLNSNALVLIPWKVMSWKKKEIRSVAPGCRCGKNSFDNKRAFSRENNSHFWASFEIL